MPIAVMSATKRMFMGFPLPGGAGGAIVNLAEVDRHVLEVRLRIRRAIEPCIGLTGRIVGARGERCGTAPDKTVGVKTKADVFVFQVIADSSSLDLPKPGLSSGARGTLSRAAAAAEWPG